HAAPEPFPSFPGDPVPPTSPSASVSFAALGDPNTFVPPDTMGSAGLSNVVAMLNTQVRIQDKLGNTNDTTTLSNFWHSAGSFTSVTDPRIAYDPAYNRWIATATADPRKA